MTDATNIDDIPEQKRSKLPLLLGLVLGLAGAGGGFYAMYSGLIGGKPADEPAMAQMDKDPDMPVAGTGKDVAFVPIDPLIVTIDQAAGTHLRFRAQLEVDQTATDEVTHLMPRVVDVLNGYLRAIDVADLEDRTALTRLRAQMLRRVQVVAGGGSVKDLLIMEFVLN